MAVQFFWGGFLFLTHIPFSSGSWGQFQRPYGCENDVVLESNASVIDELKVRSRYGIQYTVIIVIFTISLQITG